jgi:hypothetical protein
MLSFFKRIKEMAWKKQPQPVADENISVSEPPVLDFSDLANSFRRRSWAFEHYEKNLADNPRLLHWIGCINYSGYQREASLNYLIRNFQAGDENRILLLLADWVGVIQDIAEQWIITHAADLSLEQLNNNSGLLLYLARKERVRDNPALALLNRQLLQEAAAAKDWQFQQLDPMLRRHIYQFPAARTALFRKRMLQDRDPFNRTLLLRQYGLAELSSQEINSLKHDRSVYVKRTFFRFQLDNQDMPTREDLVLYCLDVNKSIRSMAQFYLQKLYGQDPCQLYREQTGYRYYFIADYARKEDLDIFIQGFAGRGRESDHRSLVRFLCFRAICLLDYSLLKDMNPVTLLTENRKMRRLAKEYLPRALSLQQLLGLRKEFAAAGIGDLSFAVMVDKKSAWHCVDLILELLIADPSADNLAFAWSRYNRRPEMYDRLPAGLRKDIQARIKLLEDRGEPHLSRYLSALKFAVNAA